MFKNLPTAEEARNKIVKMYDSPEMVEYYIQNAISRGNYFTTARLTSELVTVLQEKGYRINPGVYDNSVHFIEWN